MKLLVHSQTVQPPGISGFTHKGSAMLKAHPCHDIIFYLQPRQNGCHFPDDSFKCIFLNENVWIYSKFSLKFVPNGSINNIPTLVQIMAWRRPGDKPLSESTMVSLPMHTCVTRPQWVNLTWCGALYFTEYNMTNGDLVITEEMKDVFNWDGAFVVKYVI